MKLIALNVQRFGCIKQARVELAPGLNVLHGPNDIGKSTLVQALRAGLLLPHNSSAYKTFVPWQEPDAAPQVQLTFEVLDDGLPRQYRLTKQFGQRSVLEWSNDGQSFQADKTARGVDEKLRELLHWGLPAVGTGRGMPDSFLLKVLMASQPEVTAILGAALSDDKEPSGKQRLLGAMAAMAEDPLFKKVLDRVQGHVSDAFSETGRRRIGKGSPWIEIRDRINKADEEVNKLRTQRDQGATVLAKLRQLDDEVLVCDAAALRAEEDHSRQTERFGRQLQLQPLQEQVRAAASALAEQQRRSTELEGARTEEARLTASASAAASGASESKSAADTAASALAAAEERVSRLQNADAVRDAELVESRLKERQTQLQADIDACARQGEVAQALATRGAELKTLQSRSALEGTAAEAGEQRLSDLQGKLEVAALALHQHQLLQRYWRQRDLQSQLEQAQTAARALALHRQESAQLREQASTLELALAAASLPDESELATLKDVQHQLATQEAALSLGLTAVVTPSVSPLTLGVVADGAAPRSESLFAAATFSAAQELQLSLPGATVALRVGTQDNVRALDALRARWTREAEPLLRAAGVTTLAGLEAAVKAHGKRRDEAAHLRHAASDKERHAAGLAPVAARAETLQRQLEGSLLSLTALEAQDLEQRAERAHDESEIARALQQAEQSKRQLEANLSSVKDGVFTARAQLEALRGQLASAEAAYREAATRVQGEPQAVLARLSTELQALQAQKRGVEQELATRSVLQSSELGAAKVAHAAALASLERAAARSLESQSQLQNLEKALAEHRGKLAALSQNAAPEQLQAAEAAWSRANSSYVAAHAACLVNGALLTELELVAGKTALAHTEAVARSKRTERDQARGGLMEVGGDAVEDDLRDAGHALAGLKREQDELEVNYEAWQLLAKTLSDAEKSETRNLGEVLGAPLQARFSELTAGRYGALDVGPDLRTAGFIAAGAVRDVETLSAGTQEQLSTLFRLCLAEALQTAVILDDHLSQTDSKKMQWFRAALQDVAAKSQVVVITCWPDHYRPPSNTIDTAWKIDASLVIERY